MNFLYAFGGKMYINLQNKLFDVWSVFLECVFLFKVSQNVKKLCKAQIFSFVGNPTTQEIKAKK